ncbi:hypothetical protein BBP40_002503 [Aspergillus hancockii]|nr:hypothetical protein BBP40_002503 [Aspergillus hancockii]
MLSSGLRKGTKSCTECRRRKVRCVRLSDDAVSCRQCEDRGVACSAQLSNNLRTPRFSSRHRITQLEAQIPKGQLGQSTGPGDSDEESSGSDIPMAEKPAHLRSLFQNDWLSVDTGGNEQQAQQRLDKASTQLSIMARPRLQSLIPSKADVSEITTTAYDWLAILQGLFTHPLIIKSPMGLLESYDLMCRPDADVIALASWLITLALTAQQIPQELERSDVHKKRCFKRTELGRKIANTVESTLLCHDRLLGTIEALGMAVHFVRLQIGQGNFQKAWVKLRHVIAIAELMGLPKVFQAVRLNRTGHTDEASLHRGQLWEVMCNVDRLLGIMMNLPPGTARYQLATTTPLIVNGVVQPQVYLSNLLSIAVRVYELEELNLTQEPTTKVHMTTLEISQALGDLANQTPNAWWARDEQSPVAAEDVVQFMHHSVIMRVYLPLALQHTLGNGFVYARLPCINACESVARRYLSLRQKLPAGLFMSRVLDLQALTAAAVLLLLSHHILSADRHSIRVDKKHIHELIVAVIELLGERSKDPINSQFAAEAFNTLCALKQLLQQDDHTAEFQTLTVTVPLLGKIHIRRNVRSLQAARANNPPTSLLPLSSRRQKGNMGPQPLHNEPVFNTARSIDEAIPTPEWPWDDLSWSIEGSFDNLFGDDLMADTLDNSMPW